MRREAVHACAHELRTNEPHVHARTFVPKSIEANPFKVVAKGFALDMQKRVHRRLPRFTGRFSDVWDHSRYKTAN